MATYRGIASGETDPLAPLVAALFKALEMNPRAIAEGATGAPRVLGKALGATFLGYQAVSSTTPAVWTGLADMETISVEGSYGPWNSASTIQIAFSADNGATYGSYQNVFSNPAAATAGGMFGLRVNLRTGAVDGYISACAAGATPATGGANTTLTVPASCNAFRIRNSSGAFNLNAVAWCLGGLEA